MITLAKIQRLVADHFGVPPSIFRHCATCRQEYVRPKQMAWLLANEFGGFHVSQLGMIFGRDRTTIGAGIKHARDLIAVGVLTEDYARLRSQIEVMEERSAG